MPNFFAPYFISIFVRFGSYVHHFKRLHSACCTPLGKANLYLDVPAAVESIQQTQITGK